MKRILMLVILEIIMCVACVRENTDSVTLTEIQCTSEQVTEPATESATTAQGINYPKYPVYVRTMGVGSVGCEYGYCELGEKSGEEILKELSGFSYFFNSPDHSEGVALYYDLVDEEPQDIKLYHALAGSTEYEEYAFEGPDYEFPWGAKPQKYVICVPKEYGTHYFFAVITWANGKQDLMYFPMVYEVRESRDMGVYKDFYNRLVMDCCWPDGEKLMVGEDGDVLNGFVPLQPTK